ncbi:MAG TPA: hypothetical protein VKQ52_05820, partial [Puia sp.]|nr:hypothetical protein [Puia sp.]
MADSHNLIVAVLAKYALGQSLSEEELRLLKEWQERSADRRTLPDQLRDPLWREEHRRELEEAPSAAMWENIRRHIRESKESVEPVSVPGRGYQPSRRWRYVAAAGVIVVAG